MKQYGIENRPVVVLQSCTCDECGEECKNLHAEIRCKMSYTRTGDNNDILEVLCFTCFMKKYKKDKIISTKEKSK